LTDSPTGFILFVYFTVKRADQALQTIQFSNLLFIITAMIMAFITGWLDLIAGQMQPIPFGLTLRSRADDA